MSQNYAIIEGKKIELSGETVKNLKTALGIKDKPKQVKVYTFRATMRDSIENPYVIKIANHQCEELTKFTADHIFDRKEVEQIIAGLQELLAD